MKILSSWQTKFFIKKILFLENLIIMIFLYLSTPNYFISRQISNYFWGACKACLVWQIINFGLGNTSNSGDQDEGRGKRSVYNRIRYWKSIECIQQILLKCWFRKHNHNIRRLFISTSSRFWSSTKKVFK